MRERRERPRGTLEWAKYYRDAGLSVIPLRPHDKRPACPWKTYQQRLASDEELEGWFSDDEANIGIVCGAISGGLVVADFDNALNLRSFLDVLPELEEATVRVSTARGGHIYLITTETIRTFQVEEFGLDIKGEGSYVLAPPSIHPSGKPYEFANEATEIMGVAGFLAWLQHSLAVLGFDWTPSDRSDNGQRAGLDVAAALSGLKQGNRNETFARLVGKLHRGGMTPESIIVLLEPHASRVDFPLTELEEEVLGICSRYAQPDTQARTLTYRTAAEIITDPLPMPDVLLAGLSYRGELAILTGPYDALKSRLAMEIVRAIASGESLLGRFDVPKPSTVILIQEEINPGVFDQERVIPLLEGLPEDGAKRIIIVSRVGFRLDLEWIDLLDEMIVRTGAVAVVIDPLGEVTPTYPGFNLNFDTCVTEMLRPLKALRDKYAVTIFLVHHDPKASEFERRARGSSVLMNAPDLRILLQGIDSADGYHRSRVQVRSRNMRRPDPFNILCLEDGRVVWEEAMSISSPEKDSVVRAIKYLTKDGQGPMTTEIAEAIGISLDATKKRLLRVKADGLVDSNREGRNTRWTLTDTDQVGEG